METESQTAFLSPCLRYQVLKFSSFLSIFAKKWVKIQKTVQRYEFFLKKTCVYKKKAVILHPISLP